jgi:hypothetical protein
MAVLCGRGDPKNMVLGFSKIHLKSTGLFTRVFLRVGGRGGGRGRGQGQGAGGRGQEAGGRGQGQGARTVDRVGGAGSGVRSHCGNFEVTLGFLCGL